VNISVVVRSEETMLDMDMTIRYLLGQVPFGGRAIIYCTSKQRVEDLSKRLAENGIPNRFFHGDLQDTEKESLMEAWHEEKILCMVATSAFGVGIDAPNVRLVILAGLPYSIFDLIQQAGRSGRDGMAADTFVLYHDEHERTRLRDMQGAQLRLFHRVLSFASTNVCRMRQITRHLEEPERCCADSGIEVACDVCRRSVGCTS
jgi:ATP-dependent DNA helicase RecQ